MNNTALRRPDRNFSDSSGEEAGHPRAGVSRISEASKTSGVPGSERQRRFDAGVNSISRRTARWTSLDSDDRRVFNVWALGVTAFYSSLALCVLVAVLLGAYTPAGQKNLSASVAMQPHSSELSAAARSIGK
jgi:hypothetical protein